MNPPVINNTDNGTIIVPPIVNNTDNGTIIVPPVVINNTNGTTTIPPIVNNTDNGTTVEECDIIVGEGGTEEKPIIDETTLPVVNDGTDICITDTDPSS